MKKELKQKIKQDEFVTGVTDLQQWLAEHRDPVRITGIVLLILAIGGGSLAVLQSHRKQEADAAFSEAIEMFHAPLASELSGEKQAGRVYPNAPEKYKAAVAAFDGVERRFGALSVGTRARYYAALCRIELGAVEEARTALTEIAARHDAKLLEPALARLALADLLRRSGQVDKAVEAYKQLLADSSLPLPRDYALMSLAETLEEARRNAEARASYQQLTEEFPGSVFAGEARTRAEYLQTGLSG